MSYDFTAMPQAVIDEFCRRWSINQLGVFGSAIRDDFREDSDIDILVSFDSAAKWTLFDLVEMQDDLSNLLGRKVDFVSRRGLERSRNSIRKNEILSSTRVIYARP